MAWIPIIGKAYSPGSPMLNYIRGQQARMKWNPMFAVLHHTSAPTTAQWHSTPGEQRMINLADNYRLPPPKGKGWSSGPHFFAADDGTWAFTPLSRKGVHAVSFNSTGVGIEMVGDYDHEDFNSGAGLKVQQHAVDTIACLCIAFGWDSSSLKFHREDPLTSKTCPGLHVHKDDAVRAVHDRIVALKKAGL